MKRVLVVGAAVVAAVLGASPAGGVGPPGRSGRLTGEQEARLGRANATLYRAAYAGEMGRALRLAQEVESLRRGWQGAGHWQAVDARYEVERWSRLARLSPGRQKVLAQALGKEAIGRQLHARGQYAAAEKAFREAWAISEAVLPEGHPEMASCYNNVGLSLATQGRTAQARQLLEKALAVYTEALGEAHPSTAAGYNNVASVLQSQGKFGQALPLLEKALAIHRKALGEGHPDTANGYNNVAGCLQDQGQAARALPLFEKAQAVFRRALGEVHPATVRTTGNIALSLDFQGRLVEAQPVHEKVLAIRRKVLGEEHSDTALGYMNLATCLQLQGRAGQALPLYEKALAIYRWTLGEDHPLTATSYNNLAMCLNAQGKPSEALPQYEKALAIRRRVFREGHPDVASSYHSLAFCLDRHGQVAEALPLYEKALAITRKWLGDEHPHTILSYQGVAACLGAQGKDGPAQRLYEKALTLTRKALGEEHLWTAHSYRALASCLDVEGQAAQAVAQYEKALAIYRKALGEEHPDTGSTYSRQAYCLAAQGKTREAIALWERALLGHDTGRLGRADTGFDRARGGARYETPREGLALAHARLGEAGKAWAYAEANLARNLLDDLAGGAGLGMAGLSHLRRLDERLLPLVGRAGLTEDQRALRDELTRQRREVLQRRAKAAAARSAALVWSLDRIQEQLPVDGAVVLWVSASGANWGCVVRKHGAPRWQELSGTGPKGAWTKEDFAQARSLHAALRDVRAPAARRLDLTEAVRRRWFAPLEKHLKAEGKMPSARRLFVVPPRSCAELPVEVLAPAYTVSYAPSATVLAQALKGHRALKATPALALGDPVFRAPPPAAAPGHGVLVASVQPGGAAMRAGLRAGDVLLHYDGAKLEGVNDLVAAVRRNAKGKATYWRDGKEATVALPVPLGLQVDRRPAAEAVKAFRGVSASAASGEVYAPLPGTRAEVEALRQLLGEGCRVLLGSGASEQALDGMRGELTKCRVLHFATHGEVDLAYPERSRLILARDRLPSLSENAERAATGKRPYAGELTVEAILRGWRLDADLVVLSACQTGLGAATQGEGLLGFGYALMRAGARSVVMSRWKVSDEATALLMRRFYENLLGKTKGLKGAMGRAEALAEAKRWLAGLPKGEAEGLVKHLKAGTLRGTVVDALPAAKGQPAKPPAGERPYAHPYYWAAFVLIGDPD